MHGLSIQDSKRASQGLLKIPSFVAALFALVFCLSGHAETTDEILASMSLEQKVGQVMIWGFLGTSFDAQLDETLTKYQPGALIFFRHNIANGRQLARLNSELIRVAGKKLKAPLFLMVDQEGGVVTRVRIATPIPSALALGRINNPVYIENFAKTAGDLLKGLGFNVNLAPVMDISNPQDKTFIGNRSFGDNPDIVTSLSMAFARGMNRAGLLPTAKHFPGHGGILNDSHKTIPQKMSSAEELEGHDLLPFQKFADATFPRAIMSAHLSVPNVDPLNIPATYSPVILRDRLRDEMGYAGLVVTDDLEMSGAAISPDVGERAVRAFLAGNDMLMFAGSQANQKKAFKAMVKAVESGRISHERLDESVKRVLSTKADLKLNQLKVNAPAADEARRKLENLSREVMRKNFKIALDEKTKPWPTVDEKTHTVVFSSSLGFSYRFKREFKGRMRHFPLTPKTLDNVTDELAKENLKFAVFYASGSTTANWLNSLTPQLKEKLIVVNCTYSGEITDQDSYLAVLNLNSHSPESGAWLAESLSEPKPEPVEIRTPAGEEESETPPPPKPDDP